MPHMFIDEVKRKISSSLPTASSIVGEVIKTIYDQSSSAGDLAAIIEHDPPLTSEIIKVANSAYYSPSTTISSIKRAIVILGYDTLKELVTTTSVKHHFFVVKAPQI